MSGINVHDVLNVLDIGVLVSEIEGTPNVVMEYMLYGLPVIASNHKGCCALLGDSSFLISNDKNITYFNALIDVVRKRIKKKLEEITLNEENLNLEFYKIIAKILRDCKNNKPFDFV